MSLYIVRGLPGAGKSTFGRKLAEEKHALFIEPDMGCYDELGKYVYSPQEYEYAFIKALNLVNLAGRLGWRVVFADVLPTKNHVDKVSSAYFVDSGLPPWLRVPDVTTLQVSMNVSLRRNIHGVAPEDIRAMHDDWQDYKGETTIDMENP